MGVKGYKVFNPDWTCRGFQYEVGKTYEHDGYIGICHAGFHFCERAVDCFNYYKFDSNNKVAEVEATGLVETYRDKSVTDEIKIIRELSWHEVLNLVNIGKGNTGIYNIGNYNNGNWNTGDANVGNRNGGHHNYGVFNSGDWNIGLYNSGRYNNGDFNTGFQNTGDYNSGAHNSGNHNTGDWNSANFSAGFFNTIEQPLYVFNKPTNMSREDLNNLYAIKTMRCFFESNIWIHSKDMTKEEKVNHPEHEITGGYLKQFDYKTACNRMWERMTDDEKAAVRDIPNFDPKIFKEITGIDINLKT